MAKITDAKRWLNVSQESEQVDNGPNQTDTEVSGVVTTNNGDPEKEELGNTENAEEVAKVSKEALDTDVDQPTKELEAEIKLGQEQLDEVSGDLDTLEEAKASLEAFHDAFVSSRDAGGVSPEAFKFAKIGLERFSDLLPESTQELSVESFTATSDRFSHTQVSIEGFKEAIAKIWEAIKKALTTVYEYVKKQAGHLSLLLNKTKEKAEKVSKLAKALGNKAAPSGATVEIGGKGALFNNGQFNADIAKTVEGASTVLGKYLTGGGPIAKLFEDTFVLLDSQRPLSYKDVFKLLSTFGDAVATPGAKEKFGPVPDFVKVGIVTELPANKAVFVFAGTNPGIINKIAMRVAPVKGGTPAPASFKKPVGSASDVAKRLNEVIRATAVTEIDDVTRATIWGVVTGRYGKVTKPDESDPKEVQQLLEVIGRGRFIYGGPVLEVTRELISFLDAHIALAQRELKVLASDKKD